jgi:subtilase family serine protease
VWLATRNAASLAALAAAVSDPSSSQYGHFLTDDEYVAQFAPTSAQVASVTSWLKQSNLTVTSVGADNSSVSVSGTAAAMQTAFGAQLGLYSVNGTSQQAPTSDFSVPSSVAGLVQAVTGLSSFGHLVSDDFSPGTAFVNAPPCSTYYGQKNAQTLPKFSGKTLPYAPCGYTPSQFRGAYGVDSTGAGQAVAITDAYDSPTLKADANQYATNRGDPTFASGQFTDHSVAESPDPTTALDCGGGNNWYGEQTLDVEAVHGMATGANIDYYGAASCFDTDLFAQLAQVVADAKQTGVSIVTNSWGEPTIITNLPQFGCTPDTPCLDFDPGSVAAYESVFLHGESEGIGFYFSSGDEGDEGQNTGFISPDFPAEDPLVTAVGGTSLAIGSSNTRLFETGWGTSKWSLSSDGSSWVQSLPFQYGAGGGYSLLGNVGLTGLWPNTAASAGQPTYQNGIVPDNQSLCPTDANDNPNGCRAVPDIAMDGDPTTGMLVGQTQAFALSSVFGPAGNHYGEYRVGGTSLASPLLAGVQAVAQQDAGRAFGFANPLLYALKGTQPDPGNVRVDYVNSENADDGTVASVRTFDQDSSLNTAKGWDQVTGIGTITARYFKRVG